MPPYHSVAFRRHSSGASPAVPTSPLTNLFQMLSAARQQHNPSPVRMLVHNYISSWGSTQRPLRTYFCRTSIIQRIRSLDFECSLHLDFHTKLLRVNSTNLLQTTRTNDFELIAEYRSHTIPRFRVTSHRFEFSEFKQISCYISVLEQGSSPFSFSFLGPEAALLALVREEPPPPPG